MSELPEYSLRNLVEGESLMLSPEYDDEALYMIHRKLLMEAAELGIKIRRIGDYEVRRIRRPWRVAGERAKGTVHRGAKYGISEFRLAEMHKANGEACQICRKKLALQGAHIDHCHTTGKVRGLLCAGCNTGLGKLGDTPLGLAVAMDYLNKNSDCEVIAPVRMPRELYLAMLASGGPRLDFLRNLKPA